MISIDPSSRRAAALAHIRRHLAALAVVTLSLAACTRESLAPTVRTPDGEEAVRWSEARAWPDGVLPKEGADVTIPAGRTVLLDVSPPRLGTLHIEGTLEFDRKDLSLTAARIEVAGTLRVGTEASPFVQRATITLDGTRDAEQALGLKSKALAVLDGGTLDLHGEKRVGWTRLDATAAVGATQLTLEREPDWRAGDRIVVTPTDFEPTQYDEATVLAVAGRVVTLSVPLRFRHWGERQTIDGRVVDERAEVGLLTRNVTFRGDDACTTTGYCAHVIAFHGGVLRVEGISLYLVGQKAVLARYPIHWHMAAEVPGQYARDNAIWKSFNRCITVHGSHDAAVEGNVCHDHLGHGYFLEDGVEVRNTIAGNLAVLGRTPPVAEQLLGSDSRPASFWITNPDNTVRGNVAAGSTGFGFWVALPEHPTGMSTTDAVWPRRTPLREFSANVAHSNKSGALNVDDGPKPDGTTETTNFAPRQVPAAESPAVPADFRGFTAYKHKGRAVWLRGRGLRLSGAVLADNAIGATFAANDAMLQDALLIGETANNATPMPTGFPVRGYEFYDGTVGAQRVAFVNYQPSARGPASALGFNRSNAFALSPLNFAEGVRLVNANAAYIEAPKADKDGDKAAVFLDRDGSVAGTPGRYVVADVPLLVTSGCTRHTEWNAWLCGGAYGRLGLTSATAGELLAPATATRDDGAALALAGSGNNTASLNLAVPLTRAYTLALVGAVTKPRITLTGVKVGDWMRVALPYAPTSFTAWRDYNTNAKLLPVASLAELDASTGDRYFQANGMLYLKLVVQTGRDYAVVFVDPK